MRLPALVRRPVAVLAALTMLTTLTTTTASAAEQFSDLGDGVFTPAITALAERDLVSGYPDGRFAPRHPVSRGQLASMLVVTALLPDAEQDYFPDDEGSVHEAAINALRAAGVAEGCGDGAFCPMRPVTRGEAAAMIATAFDVPAGDTAYFRDLGEVHDQDVRAVADAGIAAGCADGHYCPSDDVLRGEAALLLARALDLVAPADPTTLAEYRAQVKAAEEEAIRQAELEAEQQRLRTWERLAECESGGRWHINTGNGYYGGLQFSLSSWRAVGGSGYPHRATKAEQIRRAERLLDLQGWGAWPACSLKLGLR